MTLTDRFRLAAVLFSVALVSGCGEDEPPTPPTTLAEAAAARDFYFGVALPDATSDRSLAVVPTHFNSVTAENAMKWGELANTVGNYDFTRADAYLELAERTGVRLRGHALLWRTQTPSDLASRIENADDPAEEMQMLMDRHFREVIPRYRGTIATWDVVNEPLDGLGGSEVEENIFYRALGPGYIADAFRLAHELDPDARLCLNEFLLTHEPNHPRMDGLVELVRGLLEEGVPLHVVGLQGHFGRLGPAPVRADLEAVLRRFTELGVDVEITELDISLSYFRGETRLEQQAAAYADATAACLAVERCRAITVWGITDDQTWLDTFPPFSLFAPHNPLLFDADLVPKPAYAAVLGELLTQR